MSLPNANCLSIRPSGARTSGDAVTWGVASPPFPGAASYVGVRRGRQVVKYRRKILHRTLTEVPKFNTDYSSCSYGRHYCVVYGKFSKAYYRDSPLALVTNN